MEMRTRFFAGGECDGNVLLPIVLRGGGVIP
jgi:hypothetical protein